MFYQGTGASAKVGFVLNDLQAFQNCLTPTVSSENSYSL